MSRTERLLELMLRLQTLQHFTVQELADEFHLSRRTMLRDLQALSMMGVPLSATPGPHGGYFLLQKQRLLPLSLTEDEAIGIVLSYEALLEYADTPFTVQSLSAITKLRNALPPDILQRLDQLRTRLVITGTQRVYTAPLLSDVLQAAIDEVYVQVLYESRSHIAERLIYPYGLYAFNGFWYCACFDQKRQQHISLRADRILSLQRREGPETPPKMSLREWLQTSDPDEEPLLLLHIVINKRGMKNVNWSAFHLEMTVDEDGNGTIRKKIPHKDLAFYARLLLPGGNDVSIESPAELVEAIKEQAQEILAHYT
ncbi:MAG TPA: YafY family protein [Ktedonosporobacter sp.]|nr:YafY family protein [Ktedonosporobacter sp.]